MLKILTAEQIRSADQFTIQHEPVTSIDLMERAADAIYKCICGYIKSQHVSSWMIFCGYGNNGGDGLALARMLHENNEHVAVFYLADKTNYSSDFKNNLERLKNFPLLNAKAVKAEKDFPLISTDAVIIDALFGSGLNRALKGLSEKLIEYLNQQGALRISIDIPSGLFSDGRSKGISFHANHTITLQSPKLSMLFSENSESVGEMHIVDIGLDQEFIDSLPSQNIFIQEEDIRQRIRQRKKFDHKGKFGHAFIHAGNTGKMGAAIMCATACARTGAGLTTAHIPIHQSPSLNVATPEVMTEEYSNYSASALDVKKYSAFALGPGIGTDDESRKLFLSLLKKISAPIVLDADALNILSGEKKWWKLIPKDSILTPHPKEFERLVGKTKNWVDRHNLQLEFSEKHSLYIILKGAYTCITTPEGIGYFNPTGNPGMAKGGSGDVLTGMVVSLLSQNYSHEDACLLSVYLHGLAADIAVEYQSEESLLASDIIDRIGDAFKKIKEPLESYSEPLSKTFDFDDRDRKHEPDPDIMQFN